jgi:hypothetical protein
MFPYFTWHPPTQMNSRDKRNAAKLEDLFYAQYGGPSIRARVQNALEVFAEKEKSNCNGEYGEIITGSSVRIFASVRKYAQEFNI